MMFSKIGSKFLETFVPGLKIAGSDKTLLSFLIAGLVIAGSGKFLMSISLLAGL